MLDAGVAGLLPLLRRISPLLFEAPPNAINAPSRAALLLVMSLLLAVEGAREGVLCERDMPQRGARGSGEVSCGHRIQCRATGVQCWPRCRAHIPASYGGFVRVESDRDHRLLPSTLPGPFGACDKAECGQS
jgi:hypothetical protein